MESMSGMSFLGDEALVAVTGGCREHEEHEHKHKHGRGGGVSNSIGSITVTVNGSNDTVVVGNQAGGNQTFTF